MKETPAKCVRLACIECDCDRYDGITPEQLERLKESWDGIYEVQSYADSIKSYDNPDDAPPGFCALDWYTHLGTCPECQKETN